MSTFKEYIKESQEDELRAISNSIWRLVTELSQFEPKAKRIFNHGRGSDKYNEWFDTEVVPIFVKLGSPNMRSAKYSKFIDQTTKKLKGK